METNFEEILKKLYYDTKTGYQSYNKLYKKLKEVEPKITLKIVKEFIKKQATEQINKEVKDEDVKSPPITGSVGHYQVDITDYPKYYKQNSGNRYILTCIEINTKKAYAIPLKNKTKNSVLDGVKNIVIQIGEDKHKLNVIQSDLGNEFNNKEMKSYLDSIWVEQRFCNVGDKRCMSVVERFNKTIRTLITKYMVANNTTRWVDNLQNFIDNYNNTYHSSIHMKPKDVDEKKEEVIIMDKNRELLEIQDNEVKVDDFVRIKLKKHYSQNLEGIILKKFIKLLKLINFLLNLKVMINL